ncbi:unnamed protein product [Diamesa hyperborea]
MLSTLESLADKLSSVPLKNSAHLLDNNGNKISSVSIRGDKTAHHHYAKDSIYHRSSPSSNHNNNNNNNNISTTNPDEPDADYIKMFVGQVPRSMDEAQLRELFEEFGRVHTINVLRDKSNGLSKGCCFVTFYTRKAALKAQDALHNIKTLVGMHHPIQMKPADSENRNERKLFVGMLNKKYSENDVRQLFSGHGTIEECTVLRDPSGQSKGCAFVTFSTKQSAIGAIKALHQSQTMEGCSAPIVVKFADTQKEKDAKRIQTLQSNLWNFASGMSTPIQSPVPVASPVHSNPPAHSSPYLAADALSPSSLQLLQQIQAFGLQQQLLHGLGGQQQQQQQQEQQPSAATTASLSAAAAAGLLAPMTVQNLLTLAAMTQPQMTGTSQSPLHNGAGQTLCKQRQHTMSFENYDSYCFNHLGHGSDALNSQYNAAAPQAAQIPQFGSFTTSPLQNSSLAQAVAAAAGKQIEGPEGCNLFIYHLPQEFTDTDLASTFLPFGNVVSAKVFIDKQTNLSKCFGFVSFDNGTSAQAAIQAMHGFQIGTKRLKVQLKRSKDSSKPY